MTVRGRIKKGKVVLDEPTALPEGTEVVVRAVKKPKAAAKPRKPAAKGRPRTLADVMKNVIGKAAGLPPDASINHDYYLYGLPKQQ